MAKKEPMLLEITLELADKGAYIVIKDSMGGLSEYMVLDTALNYLMPVISSALRSGVLLSGPDVQLIPPNQGQAK